MQYCTNCANPVPDGQSFCTACGAKVNDVNPQIQYRSQQQSNYSNMNNQQNYGGNNYNNGGYNNNAYGNGNYNNSYNNGNYNNGGFGGNNGYGNMDPSNNYGIMRRDIAMCVIYTIITCGIYGIYWMCKLNDEVNFLSGNSGDTPGGTVILLTIVTCGIYGYYWIYKMGQRIDVIANRPGDSNAILYIVLYFFGLGIVDHCLMQDTINKKVAGY